MYIHISNSLHKRSLKGYLLNDKGWALLLAPLVPLGLLRMFTPHSKMFDASFIFLDSPRALPDSLRSLDSQSD